MVWSIIKSVTVLIIWKRAFLKIEFKMSSKSPKNNFLLPSDHPCSFKLINGRVEMKFSLGRLYCMSSQISQDYTSWVQLAWFIQRGCEHCHNSIKTGLLGLYDPALLKGRQSLKNPFIACIFISIVSQINYVSWLWHNRQEDQTSPNVPWI